jgi:hypothetical protein
VIYQYKQPFRDGSTHVVLEPLDFMYRMYGMPRAHDCRAGVVPDNPSAFPPSMEVDAGGRATLEQLPAGTQVRSVSRSGSFAERDPPLIR